MTNYLDIATKAISVGVWLVVIDLMLITCISAKLMGGLRTTDLRSPGLIHNLSKSFSLGYIASMVASIMGGFGWGVLAYFGVGLVIQLCESRNEDL